MKNLIVLAHGWIPITPDYSMYPLAKRMQNHGDILKLDYPKCYTRSLHEMSLSTLDYLEDLRSIYDRITFIGHSMGAVIGARILQEDHTSIDILVGIAGAFRGTRFNSPWSWGSSSEELQKGSAFMRQLPTKSPVDSLAIVPAFDILVSERSSASYCHEMQIIPWTSHLSVVLSQRTYLEISSWLDYMIIGRDPTVDSPVTGTYSSASI